jgi:hypothetical protein
MDRVEHDLSASQWTALTAAWGGCAYCGETTQPLQRDCVLALSRGGRYTLENIVPACRSCNTGKCNDEVTTWLRRKRLDERAFCRATTRSARHSCASSEATAPCCRHWLLSVRRSRCRSGAAAKSTSAAFGARIRCGGARAPL